MLKTPNKKLLVATMPHMALKNLRTGEKRMENLIVKHQNMLFYYNGSEGEPLKMSALATENV